MIEHLDVRVTFLPSETAHPSIHEVLDALRTVGGENIEIKLIGMEIT